MFTMVNKQKRLGDYGHKLYNFELITEKYIKDHPGCYWDIKENKEIDYS